jgi:hypothetical protein
MPKQTRYSNTTIPPVRWSDLSSEFFSINSSLLFNELSTDGFLHFFDDTKRKSDHLKVVGYGNVGDKENYYKSAIAGD